MGGLSFWHIALVGVLFMLLFGRGRFSEAMGDIAKGIKSFKKGMSEEDEPAPPRIGSTPPAPAVIDAEKQNDKQA
jgi:sec-independent protein translocase protein TatA